MDVFGVSYSRKLVSSEEFAIEEIDLGSSIIEEATNLYVIRDMS